MIARMISEHRLMDTESSEPARTPPSEEHRACLGLGSNVEAPSNLRRAIRRLRRLVAVDAISTAWQSPAVGVDGPDYINAAVLVRTPHSKEKLMTELRKIESELGRVRGHRSAPQVTIDIDLLVFDHESIKADLWSQIFRAAPVAELLPDLRCPSTGEAVSHAAIRLAGSSPITPRPEIFSHSRRTGASRANPASHNRTRTP
jgi:2-amino-4-hydroxy-6-hydroxymethyldihydropteridine diphosphokinase